MSKALHPSNYNSHNIHQQKISSLLWLLSSSYYVTDKLWITALVKKIILQRQQRRQLWVSVGAHSPPYSFVPLVMNQKYPTMYFTAPQFCISLQYRICILFTSVLVVVWCIIFTRYSVFAFVIVFALYFPPKYSVFAFVFALYFPPPTVFVAYCRVQWAAGWVMYHLLMMLMFLCAG